VTNVTKHQTSAKTSLETVDTRKGRSVDSGNAVRPLHTIINNLVPKTCRQQTWNKAYTICMRDYSGGTL